MESYLHQAAKIIEWAAEGAGILVIAIGLLRALIHFARTLLPSRGEPLVGEHIRLTLGQSLTLALELLLAADIAATAIAPSWQAIGQLAAIATIRTALNFFLQREMAQAAEHTRQSAQVGPPLPRGKG